MAQNFHFISDMKLREFCEIVKELNLSQNPEKSELFQMQIVE